MLADRINKINPSQTMKISAEARRLAGDGADIIDLSAGEPDFPTPPNVKEAAVTAIYSDFTKYTLNSGIIELRKAISEKLKKENNADYSVNEIVVSNGAKQGIFNALHAIINTGDEVIIPSPFWVSYPEIVKIAHGFPVIAATKEENNFKIKPEELSSVLTKKTKALIICNPSNPTGTIYNRQELEQIAEICRDKNIMVLADEIYEKIIYDNSVFTSFASLPGMRERTILVNGVSKAYSMTGWRIGYTAGPYNIIKGIEKIQSHSTSNASSISQAAALEALMGPQDYINQMKQEFEQRRNFLHSELLNIEGITCNLPGGAFYMFPNISSFFNKSTEVMKVKDSFDLSMYLLYQAGVAVVPGISFGCEGNIRIAYSASMDKLEEAVKRIKAALSKLS